MWEIYERLLAEKGVTSADVSRATGIRESTLSAWKQRGGAIGAERARLIAEYFGVTLQYLMTGKDPDGYYENDETANIAQEIHDNRELRGLFSAVKDADPRMIKALYDMFMIMKRAEDGEYNENKS